MQEGIKVGDRSVGNILALISGHFADRMANEADECGFRKAGRSDARRGVLGLSICEALALTAMTLLAAVAFENMFSVLRVAARNTQSYSGATQHRKQ